MLQVALPEFGIANARTSHIIWELPGDVAQLGERSVRNAEVGSSILLVSTVIT